MTKVHLAQLLNVDWNHHERPYAESIAKLESLEPQIIRHNEHEKRLTALKGGGKSSRYPQSKNNDKKKNSNKKNDSNSYSKCDTCGKTHKGICRYAKEGEASKPTSADSNKKRKWKKEVVAVVKEVMENSDSDSDSEEWKKLTKDSIERAYVLGAAQSDQNYYDSDISIDTTTTKQYLKRFRKAEKGKKRRRRRPNGIRTS